MKSGFFVPNSVSDNYVSTKKDEGGSYIWDKATNETNLGKQVALQTVNKQYASTIDNAYSSYLSANRGLIGSNMGEGYKEAYSKIVQDQLAAQVEETNNNAASARSEIITDTNKTHTAIQDAFNTEVANMDRTYRYANDYLSYLKLLTNKTDGVSRYLTTDQESLTIDDMYDSVFQAQPRDYLDDNGNQALSYSEWVNSQLKDTESDTAWAQWLFSQGGLQQSVSAAKNFKKTSNSEKSTTDSNKTSVTALYNKPTSTTNGSAGGGGRSR